MSQVHSLLANKSWPGASSKFPKSDFYSVFQGHRKFDLFGERQGEVHRSHRRLVSSIYSAESLKDFEPYVDQAIDLFIDKMNEMEERSFDMGKWVQLFAFGMLKQDCIS